MPVKAGRGNSQSGLPHDDRSPNYRQPPIRPRIHRAPKPYDGESDAKKMVGMAHSTYAILCKTKPICEKPKRVYVSMLQRIMKKLSPAEFTETKPNKANLSTRLKTGQSQSFDLVRLRSPRVAHSLP